MKCFLKIVYMSVCFFPWKNFLKKIKYSHKPKSIMPFFSYSFTWFTELQWYVNSRRIKWCHITSEYDLPYPSQLLFLQFFKIFWSFCMVWISSQNLIYSYASFCSTTIYTLWNNMKKWQHKSIPEKYLNPRFIWSISFQSN